MAEPILVLTGPTASGKTALALEVARRLGGEIISMDSRQVYRGMDVGTAKPTPEERSAIPHHGIDIIDPGDRYSAGQFARDAHGWIAEIAARGRVPLVVGGTGFFLRALLHPLFPEPPLDQGRRRLLEEWLAAQPAGVLARWAERLDPQEGGGRRDPQRLARRIEVALLTGRPLAWWHAQAPAPTPSLAARIFVLELPRPELYRRIDERVLRMVAAGLFAEVSELLRRGLTAAAPGLNATGYIESISYLRGERPLDETIALIQAATRGYARRQLTWFRRQLPDDAIRLQADRPVEALADAVVAEWRRVAE